MHSTNDQFTRFHEQGFVVADGFFGEAEIDHIGNCHGETTLRPGDAFHGCQGA